MSYFTADNQRTAHTIIARYPRARSAIIPLLHLAQSQAGWVSPEAMTEIGQLVGATSAEVLGTASFYEMFKRQPVGRYLINVCVTLSCQLAGADELLRHAERHLGVTAGGTTADGKFTLAQAECQAACTEAPCLQVNYRYRYRVTPDSFDQLIGQLASGELDKEIPPHGTVARTSQTTHPIRTVGAVAPELVTEAPVWLTPSESAR